MITILNPSRQPLVIFEDYLNDEITEQTNGAYTLSFSVILDEEKSQYIQVGNIAEVEGQYFNIVKHRRTRAESNEVAIAIECEQVSYDLLFHLFEGGFIHANTPWVLMNMALEGTGFTVGAVQFSGYVSVDLKEGVNARGVLMEIAAQTGCELHFDKYTVSLLVRRGQDRGVQFRLGKNLKGIVKDVNGQSGQVLTAYEIDVVELNTLPEFEGLEYFELGDTVDIIDEELGINEQQRIIEYSYSPKRRINSKVTIANYIEGIQDTIYRIQTTTVGKDKWMYGVKIGPDEGIVIERYDKMARSVFNADEFRMQKGNGNGSYTDSLYFDPINEEYEFVGIVRAGQFIGGRIAIGENFSVDETGHMKAVGADFSGDITASTINGTDIYGSYIEGGEILGSTIRTATSGERIELDPYGFRFYDDFNARRVELGTNPQANISGHTYYDSSSQSQGLIYAANSELHVIGNNNLRLGTNFGTTYLQGSLIDSVADRFQFRGVVDFTNATVIGL